MDGIHNDIAERPNEDTIPVAYAFRISDNKSSPDEPDCSSDEPSNESITTWQVEPPFDEKDTYGFAAIAIGRRSPSPRTDPDAAAAKADPRSAQPSGDTLPDAETENEEDQPPSPILKQIGLGDFDEKHIEEEVRTLCAKHKEIENQCCECCRRLREDPSRATDQELNNFVTTHLSLQNVTVDIGLASQHPSAGEEVRQLPTSMNLTARFDLNAISTPVKLLASLVPHSTEFIKQFLIRSYQNACLLHEVVVKFRNVGMTRLLGDLTRWITKVEDDSTGKRSLTEMAQYWLTGTTNAVLKQEMKQDRVFPTRITFEPYPTLRLKDIREGKRKLIGKIAPRTLDLLKAKTSTAYASMAMNLTAMT